MCTSDADQNLSANLLRSTIPSLVLSRTPEDRYCNVSLLSKTKATIHVFYHEQAEFSLLTGVRRHWHWSFTPPRACILCIGLSLRPPSRHSNHPPIRSYEPVPTLPRPSFSLQHVPHSTSTYMVSHSSTFPFSPRSPILTFRQTHPCRRAGVEFARKMVTLCHHVSGAVR